MSEFSLRDTGQYGIGVYAKKDFVKNESVHKLNGEKLKLEQIVHRIVQGRENEDDILQIGIRTYYDLDALSRSINHSCNPSTGVRGTSELFALRDIKSGEQITYDYSTTVAPTDWLMLCKCGEKNCRKRIGDIRSIPKKQLAWYVERGALQNYMKPILSAIASNSYKIPDYEIIALKKIHK
jgi:SET domain-containing protein